MAIVKLQKVTFYGLTSQRDMVLDGLQQLGCLHLIDLTGKAAGKPLDDPERHEVHDAIKYLQACPVQNTNQLTYYAAGKSCLAVAHEALANQRLRDELSDERDHLQRAIELVLPWGDFQLPDREAMRGLLLWFYAVPLRQMEQVRRLDVPWTLINQDRQFAHSVVVSPAEPDMPVPRGPWIAGR